MKSMTSTNWKSFENVANYHGEPNMCFHDWVSVVIPTQSPKLEGDYGCCIHG